MQLENIAVRLRRRSPWEALDLGHALLRAWAVPAGRLWLACYVLPAVLLYAVCWSQVWIAVLLLWWLRPFFDRVLLFAFSRAIFAQPAGFADLAAALPALLLRSGLGAALTWRRFNPARSLLLPVAQLEGQRGAAARARCRILSRRVHGHGVWLTLICMHAEVILWASFALALGALVPHAGDDPFSGFGWFLGDISPEREFFSSLLLVAAQSLVEPLYVASGFALYLNRRSELEGWDIELAFRRMGAGAAPRPAARAGGLAALCLGIALALPAVLNPLPAMAEVSTTSAAAAAPREPRAVIQSILADQEFGREIEESAWRWRERPDAAREDLPAWIGAILRAAEFIGEILQGLTAIAALLGAAFLIYLLLRLGEARRGRAPRRAAPEFLFGLDLRPASLPADIAAAARAALAAGQPTAALSLLYRGALVALIHRWSIDFLPGDTEADCRRRAATRLDAPAGAVFAELVAAWQLAAYARTPPARAQLEALCDAWDARFGARSAAEPAP